MHVFVTGASGFIGSAVVRELQAAAHEVTGLARSDAAADTLTQMGVNVHRGELTDTDGLAAAAGASDGVIHLAFNHDFATTPREVASEMDLRAVEAMIGAIEGSGKPFVLTSGTALISLGRTGTEARIVTETDAPVSVNIPRAASEAMTLAAADRGVRSSVVRLPPTVHGAGDRGFIPMLINLAREKGVSAYVGDGANRWPAVHRMDAARVFRLALEKAAPGATLHAVSEEGIAMREIAGVIGGGLGVPVRSMTKEEAQTHFSWMALFVVIDNPTSSEFTREALGWSPQEMGLLMDMRESGYFA